jgi:hypothetical protein
VDELNCGVGIGWYFGEMHVQVLQIHELGELQGIVNIHFNFETFDTRESEPKEIQICDLAAHETEPFRWW